MTRNSSLLIPVNSLIVTCFDQRNFNKLLNDSPILKCRHFENLSKRSTHIMDTDMQTFYSTVSTSVSSVMHNKIDSTRFLLPMSVQFIEGVFHGGLHPTNDLRWEPVVECDDPH
jgi:hypothetical protein